MKFLDYLLIAFVASAVVAAIVSIVKKAKNGSCCCGCSACKKYTGDKKRRANALFAKSKRLSMTKPTNKIKQSKNSQKTKTRGEKPRVFC